MAGSVTNAGDSAREYHEREEYQRAALRVLRRGEPLTKHWWRSKYAWNGSRVGAGIHVLRRGHGLTIDGHGTERRPYVMPDPNAYPALRLVTKEFKARYYDSPHWARKRAERYSMDSYSCVLCRAGPHVLQCHHITYETLFCEQTRDLMTLCTHCHDVIHGRANAVPDGHRADRKAISAAWPIGATPQRHAILGLYPDPPDWVAEGALTGGEEPAPF